MTDARAVVPDLDDLTSFFGVYDGHGGLILIDILQQFFKLAVVLSVDHKPMDQAERNRIQRAGGEVVRDKIHTAEGGFRGRRVGIPRINGILTVSRAIGIVLSDSFRCDFEFKNNKQMNPEQQVVTCEPSVRGLTINHDVEFLVVASDGIWKSMSSQGVVDLVHHYTRSGVDDRSICEQLCQRSLKSMDNSTVILVRFKPVCQLAAPVDMNAPLGALQEEEEEQEDEESAGEIRPA
ncbi:hypothetical protein HU200_009004 [Digitaria exilis]|uniref:protein-serine/threonine phosphatase n=1 Tax=Digitaria exilis TaxID=1010633 RepID=A0A835FKT0_9POAL|nr:hypothetical protein HU200_009004 [Digitaria exilis]